MGHMVDGRYHSDDDATTTRSDGAWERSRSTVRGRIGAERGADFPPEAGRYHLYVAWNCPWAHRALLVRALKRLEDLLPISAARPNRTDQGWVYDETGPYSDPALGVRALHQVYSADPMGYTGRVTTPVLWDKAQGRMVSNESADIVRMLDHAFDGLAPETPELAPERLAPEIDRWNDLIYPTLNNGVYRAGFASTQSPYETAAREVFDTLDRIEAHLAGSEWLCGDTLTEADLRLFPTLARFDVAYHYAFRCNLRRLVDYPRLWAYARRFYHLPGVAGTVRFDIYKQGYFSPSEKRNPLGIVPIGPEVDWSL